MANQTRHLHTSTQRHDAISFLRQNFNLWDDIHHVRDAVFISIDFENVQNLKKTPTKPRLKTQIGVCILDTRRIGKISFKRILDTFNFTTGPWGDRDNEFLFGQTERTTVD